LVLLLLDRGPHPDHLGEGPVRDAVAVGQAPAAVPQDAFGDAVHVLLELPRQARLADAGDAGHGHEVGASLLDAGVEEVLHETELEVPADPGWLEGVGAPDAPSDRNNPERAPHGDGVALALQLEGLKGLVGDRRLTGVAGALCHQHGAGRRGGLDP
jgi:hypothetical protein